jgi:hypothetical protein
MHRSSRPASRPRSLSGRQGRGFTVVQILVAVGLLGLVLAALVSWLREPPPPATPAPAPGVAAPAGATGPSAGSGAPAGLPAPQDASPSSPMQGGAR